jgi:Domain of unknown function (DUF4389)
MSAIAVVPPNPNYPATVEIENPPKLSRLLIFVKWLLLIPHYIALFFLSIAAWFVLVICWFAVLFTGRYPESLFNFLVGTLRWSNRILGYFHLQTDDYPPFSLDDDPAYPMRVKIDYPSRIARWRPLVNWLLAIPCFIAVWLLGILMEVSVIIAWFAILITGRYPQPLFDIVTIYLRWSTRTLVFAYWMTEEYPPLVWA